MAMRKDVFMARRLKSLLPSSGVDGHEGEVPSPDQADHLLANGQAANGQAANGQLANGHTANGQLTNGQLPVSGAATDQPPQRDADAEDAGDQPVIAPHPALEHLIDRTPEAAPTAVLDRPVHREPEAGDQAGDKAADEPAADQRKSGGQHRQRRRWIGGHLRDVPPANALGDMALLGRVRDRLKELPDEGTADGSAPPADSQADQGDANDVAMTAIKETFGLVAAAGDMAASYFYGWLFANNPELRDLFPPAMDEQRDRLFIALTRIVRSLSTPSDLASYLAQLGRDHRKYSVRPEMYGAVGAALVATLRAFAGPAFTPAAEDAWVSTYGVASDLMIKAANEAGVNTPAYWDAEVIGHERRGHDIAVLTVAPEQPLTYLAGQHITVQTKRWPKVWRPYSIACRPREDGLIRFHVKAISGGWVSNTLVDHISVGDPLILGPAIGNMTLATAGKRDLLCVAGGTGLAPLKAIAEQVIYEEAASRTHRKVWLFCGAKTEKDFYDLRDLWRLSDAYPWLEIHPVTSDDPAYYGMQGNVGRVAARYLPHQDCEAYVAGPVTMVAETIKLLAKVGLPAERIHYDDSLLGERRRVGSGT
jgi:NAD(P)H-flavin reductase/hemoglobin-like flavoprotein